MDKERYVKRSMVARNLYARDSARCAFFSITDRGIDVYETRILCSRAPGAGAGGNSGTDDADRGKAGIGISNRASDC